MGAVGEIVIALITLGLCWEPTTGITLTMKVKRGLWICGALLCVGYLWAQKPDTRLAEPRSV